MSNAAMHTERKKKEKVTQRRTKKKERKREKSPTVMMGLLIFGILKGGKWQKL